MLILKKYFIWIALALTLVASIWASKQENIVDEMSMIQPKNKRHIVIVSRLLPMTAALNIKPIKLHRADVDDSPQNIFTTFVDESLLAEQSAKSQPEPPPLNPFIYAGKIVDEGKVTVFLTEGSNNYSVKAGDLIDEAWQVLSIAPPMMTIQYIPRKIKMQMQIGAVS